MKSLLDYVNQFNLSLESKDTMQKEMNITKKQCIDDGVLQQETVSTTTKSLALPVIPHPRNTHCMVCEKGQKSLLKQRLLSALNDNKKASEVANPKRPILKRACKEKFFCYTPLKVMLMMSILTFTLTNAKGTIPVKSVKKVMKNTAMVKTSKIGKALVNSIFNSGARENLMQNLYEGNSFLRFIQQAIKSAPRNKALAEVSKNELLLCKPIVGNQICFSECSKSGGGSVKYSYDFCYTSHTSNNWQICECTFRQEVLNYLKLVKNKLLTHSTYQSAQNTMLWLVLTILATIIGICVLLLFIRCMCIYYNFRAADGRPGAPRKSILRRQKVRFDDDASQKSAAEQQQLHTQQPPRARPTTLSLSLEQPNECTTTQQQELTITRIN